MDNLGQAVTTHYAKAHPDPQLGGTPFDPVTQCTVRYSLHSTHSGHLNSGVCVPHTCVVTIPCTFTIVEEKRENWAKNWSSSRTSHFGFSLKLKLPNATLRGCLEVKVPIATPASTRCCPLKYTPPPLQVPMYRAI